MWQTVTVRVNEKKFVAYVKSYEEPSKFGIDGGRISKLQIKDGDVTVLNYDRGWDVKPESPEVLAAYQTILNGWN